ncbi:hypothetical protein RND71_027618 [Anisodus tanguticus]|uniref:Fungal lipase-type domain-containing protein n=1 Tax=Anisodus tanguticus TaxID=243964 RepID=A0AAE1RGY8_9SOLA|nr:hypothetical protein RND71_027618 [Anisodus tanguticus]
MSGWVELTRRITPHKPLCSKTVEDSNLVVVAFRGTIPYNADHWITDVDLSWYELKHEEEWLLDKLEGVYTFGQPRVGDPQFGNFTKDKFNKYDVKYYRHVYSNDMVPRLPYDDSTVFKHFGSCLYYNNLYKGWGVHPSLEKDNHYREEWFSKMFRMVGLVIPGLSAHTTIDYVNLTRLGPVLHPPKSAHQDCLKDD